MESSKRVGGLGTGGAGVTGAPNGLREPVWCDFTACAIGGDVDDGSRTMLVSGVDAGRAGTSNDGF